MNVWGANVIALASASALVSACVRGQKLKPEEIGLSYCTCVFLVTRTFT